MTSIFRWPRHAQWLLVLLPLVFVLGGCDSGGANYTETEDLESLRERGQLRLLAPRFDEEQAMVREGVPLQEFREQAEILAQSLGLTPRWVYADSTDNLDDMLNEGLADLIVTIYTVTESRQEKVDFSNLFESDIVCALDGIADKTVVIEVVLLCRAFVSFPHLICVFRIELTL